MGKNRKLRAIVLLALIAALALTSCNSAELAAPPLDEPVSVIFDTAQVKRGSIKNVEYFEGSVMPEVHELSFKRSGTLQKSYVSVGDSVKKGELLMELDATALQRQRDSITKAMESMRANHQFEREKLAVSRDIVAHKLKRERQAGNSDAARLLEINLEEANNRIAQLDELHTFDYDGMSKQLDAIDKQSEGVALYSPIDGEVLYVYSQQKGAPIRAFDNMVCVADNTTLYVEVLSKRANISLGAVKAEAKMGEKLYALELEELSMSEVLKYYLDDKPIPSRFKILDPHDELLPGEYSHVYVTKNYKEDCLYIPINAYYAGKPAYVYLMQDGERVYREVQSGATTTTAIEIVSGLQEGDEVFVKQ